MTAFKRLSQHLLVAQTTYHSEGFESAVKTMHVRLQVIVERSHSRHTSVACQLTLTWKTGPGREPDSH